MSKARKQGWDPMVLQQFTTDPRALEHEFEYREPVKMVRREAWRNRLYDAAVYYFENDTVHISFKRLDRAAVRDWRHFQAIKNEIVSAEREAVEIFPAESELMDGANQYHLWVLPEGARFALGMAMPNGPEVASADDLKVIDWAAYRTQTRAGKMPQAPGGQQRGWEPGIPTGLGRQ